MIEQVEDIGSRNDLEAFRNCHVLAEREIQIPVRERSQRIGIIPLYSAKERM